MTTNKAAALAKFLERKLQHPDGLNSLDPNLVELAVKNAKETVVASKGKNFNSSNFVRLFISYVSSYGVPYSLLFKKILLVLNFMIHYACNLSSFSSFLPPFFNKINPHIIQFQLQHACTEYSCEGYWNAFGRRF